MLGFGNVGRAFARLLIRKQALLRRDYDLDVAVTGIATAHHAMAINPAGLDLSAALACMEQKTSLASLSTLPLPQDIPAFVQSCPADVLLENSPVNHHDGQPAVDWIRSALLRGLHVVTANKGPVVFAYHSLSEAARQAGRRFLFESAVMDGAPIFAIFRNCLPAAQLNGFSGILNSTTNFVLRYLEEGKTFEEAIAAARLLGIVEADPSEDIDGWDAAIKICVLTNVLMGLDLTPQQVERQGIGAVTSQMAQQAYHEGGRIKLVCRARRIPGGVQARVATEIVPASSALYNINGYNSCIEFETDVIPGLGIVENNPGIETTAYGLLADLINIYREK